jgi:hypothetical protein
MTANYPKTWDGKSDHPWNPGGFKFPFYEDGNLFAVHDVFLSRVYHLHEEFLTTIKPLLGVTRNTPDKLFVMYQLLKLVQDRNGYAIEVGVYRGGTAKLIALVLKTQAIHLYDTFTGIPFIRNKVDDRRMCGDFSRTNEAWVKRYLGEPDRIHIHKGIFPDTFNQADLNNGSVVFAHLDTDKYHGTMEGLIHFYPKMIEGGVIVVDDYHCYDDVDQAVHEYMNDKPEPICQFALGQCFIIKKGQE